MLTFSGCISAKYVLIDSYNRKYEGKIDKGNKESGTGIFVCISGDYYKGEFSGNKFHGKGVMIYSNGDKYSGDFKNGKIEGKGIFTWKNGDEYNGEFINNKPDGKGTIKHSNGDIYNGRWKNGYYNGKGTMEYSNGDKYIGGWEKNQHKGEGIYIWSDGDKYKGKWIDGKLNKVYLQKVINHVHKNKIDEIKENKYDDIIVTIKDTVFKKEYLSIDVFVQNIGSSKSIYLYYGDWRFNFFESDKSYNMGKAKSHAPSWDELDTQGTNFTMPAWNYFTTQWFKNKGSVFILYMDKNSISNSSPFIEHKRLYPKSIVSLNRYGTYSPIDQPIYDIQSTGLKVGFYWEIIFDINELPKNIEKYEIVVAGNIFKVTVDNVNEIQKVVLLK
jgi:hypothetical protein